MAYPNSVPYGSNDLVLLFLPAVASGIIFTVLFAIPRWVAMRKFGWADTWQSALGAHAAATAIVVITLILLNQLPYAVGLAFFYLPLFIVPLALFFKMSGKLRIALICAYYVLLSYVAGIMGLFGVLIAG